MKLSCAITLAAALLFSGLGHAQTPPLAPAFKTPTIVSLDSFGMVVTNLDAAMKFYHDTLGLNVVVPITTTKNADVLRVTNTGGATLRYAKLQIPNEPYAIELVEYAGIDRKTMTYHHNDPGASFLNFGYLNVADTFEKLRAAKPFVFSARGIPTNAVQGRNSGAWIRDPDGHMLEIMQGGWDPERKSFVGTKNLYRSHFGMTMENHLDALAFYRDILGFDLTDGFPPMVAAGKFESAKGIAGAVGVPPEANWTGVAGHCAFARCEMFEFKDAPRTAFRPRMQDPGGAYLSMWVSDLDGLLAKMKTAMKLEIITPGGAPVLVSEQRGVVIIPGAVDPRDNAAAPVRVSTSREILIRDPAGFPILLKQRVS